MKGSGRRKGAGKHRFLFVADQLALDLVNTEVVENRQRVDWLLEPGDLAAWLRQAGLAPGSRSLASPRLLRRAKALRAEIRRMAEALAAGRSLPASVLLVINHELREERTFHELVRTGKGYEVRMRSESGAGVLAPIAQSAAELLAGEGRSRVRRCGNPACILYFYDTTRSHTRRWCSMAGCGNRMKAAAHYRRKKIAD